MEFHECLVVGFVGFSDDSFCGLSIAGVLYCVTVASMNPALDLVNQGTRVSLEVGEFLPILSCP